MLLFIALIRSLEINLLNDVNEEYNGNRILSNFSQKRRGTKSLKIGRKRRDTWLYILS